MLSILRHDVGRDAERNMRGKVFKYCLNDIYDEEL
jgi:hypothetical protein